MTGKEILHKMKVPITYSSHTHAFNYVFSE